MEVSNIMLSTTIPNYYVRYGEINTIVDSSGYGYNGACTSTSSPIIASDSPRYSSCVKFDTTAKYIQVTGLPALGNIYSIS